MSHFSDLTPVASQNEKGVSYKYYEGQWSILPNFVNLPAISSGVLDNMNISLAKQAENFGFDFTASMEAPQDGVYSFWLTSDDGSKLYVNDSLLIDNDGGHAMVTKKAQVVLKQGWYNIQVPYFNNVGGAGLEVWVVLPDQRRVKL
ncbi:MAG: hypothetical protein HC896_06595 [Bacteroidales bacterium]|nr:hypothetical protein [Bacteroidales bacterium]